MQGKNEYANANLKVNGGTGEDIIVDASRLMVEPNQGKKWVKGPKSGKCILPVRVRAFQDPDGKWNRTPFLLKVQIEDTGYTES